MIEAVTGTSYNEHVRTAIVAKLGLGDLGPELDPGRSAQYAAGYSAYAYADQRVPIEHIDTGALASATGFYSTAHDLVSYWSAHLTGDDRLLTDASKRQMQHGLWKTTEEDGPQYGLGLQINKVAKRDVFGHGGGYPGHITRSLVDADRRVAVSVLTNAIDGPANQLAEGVLKLIDLAESKDRGEGDLARFTGRFANLWGVDDIALLGGRLYLIDPTAADPTAEPTQLEPSGDSTLRVTSGSGYGGYGEHLRFEFAAGRIESVRGASGQLSRPIEQYSLPDRVTAVR
ncbi:serine hydrolase domain-containing protein [Kribbella sp. DT2]|uniref:serine hydrolase domain-containing protein n=1 Tax=Kribbella sp. DT2 TaxID=3393427 RepID=UPI003CF08F9D